MAGGVQPSSRAQGGDEFDGRFDPAVTVGACESCGLAACPVAGGPLLHEHPSCDPAGVMVTSMLQAQVWRSGFWRLTQRWSILVMPAGRTSSSPATSKPGSIAALK